MRKITAATFVSLDGIMQAPGGPEEDPVGGFEYGGWTFHYWDDVMGAAMGETFSKPFALLLGRKTYDIFAAFWPYQEEGVDAEISTLFNRIPKYVASRSNPTLGWANSTLLGPDLASEVRQLRERHESIHVIGSVDLVQTLFAQRLFDRLTLWVYPVVLGSGKKVFASGAAPANLTLTEPAVTSPNGAVLMRYALADGTPGTGDMSRPDRGV